MPKFIGLAEKQSIKIGIKSTRENDPSVQNEINYPTGNVILDGILSDNNFIH